MSFIIGILTFFLVVNCAVVDLAGADPTAQEGRRRRAGVRRRRGGRAVRRGFGQRADQGHKMGDRDLFHAGPVSRAICRTGCTADNSAATFEKQRATKTIANAAHAAAAAAPIRNRRLPAARPGKQSAGGAPVRARPTPRRRRRNRNNAMAISQRARRIFSRARFCFCALVMAGVSWHSAASRARAAGGPHHHQWRASRNRSIRPSSPASRKCALSSGCLKD